MTRKDWIRRGAGVLVGAAGAYLWFYFLGCATGGCSLRADPMLATGVGAVVGAMLVW